MSELYNTIEAEAKRKGIKNITQLCIRAGIGRATLTELKQGRTQSLTTDTIAKIAESLDVSIDYLVGKQPREVDYGDSSNVTILEDERLVRFPIIGSISAGYSSLAVEEYTGDYELIPFAGLRDNPNEYFVLRVSGNSMYPRLLDGDRVLVRKSKTVENGKVAVILYNGDEATIKKINYEQGKAVELIPFNPEYEIKRIEGAELEQCHVLGEVIQLIRSM